MPFNASHIAGALGLALALSCSAASIGQRDESAPCVSHSCQTQKYYPPAADCIEYLIPVKIESDNVVFNAAHWKSDYDLTNFLSLATTRATAGYASPFNAAKVTEEGTYNIAASFCTPKQESGKEKTVILATHGIGPARDHWNSPHDPEKYNFVQWAIDHGYSVFFYDRLGCGYSQKVSGYTNQLSMAVAVIQQLSAILRGGKFTGSVGVPDKLVLMGFSFASFATHTAIAATPEIADAVVLTAIGFNTTGINGNGLLRSFVPRVAALQNPAKYGDRDSGYLTWVDKFAQIDNYFKEPHYDIATTDFAEEVKQPFAIGEFLTFTSFAQDAGNYTGPVLAITGETDYIVCDGYCPGIFEEPARTYYRNAKLTTYLHPGASHNFNFHHNATGAYKVITDFLAENGL